VGAHLANALPDLEEDRANGVVGLPHRLGARRAAALAAVLLLAATVVLALGPGSPGVLALLAVAVAGGVTAVGLVLARRPGSRAAFRAALVVAVVDVALLLARGDALTGG
jgi:4-hydroxybenzoate polyprenyltransferase